MPKTFRTQETKRYRDLLIAKHPSSPTWIKMCKEMFNDETSLCVKIAKSPSLTRELEQHWEETRDTLRRLLNKPILQPTRYTLH